VLRAGDKVCAIEVKSNHASINRTAIDPFIRQFKPDRVLLVGESGMPLEEFLRTPPSELIL